MPRYFRRLELPFRRIARLIGIEFRLRHAGIVNLERVEAAMWALRDQVAGAQLQMPFAAVAAVLRVLTGGFSSLLAHAAILMLDAAQSGERDAPSCVPPGRALIYR